jgi:hypothetical protein
VQPEPGKEPLRTDARSPGADDPPPIPDQAEPAALSPRDAAIHLERAHQRIVQERKAYRRRGAAAPEGVPAW